MRIFQHLSPVYRYKRLISSKMQETPARPEYISKLRECYRLEEYKQIVVPVFKKALLYGNQTAIKDCTGDYSYLQLYMNSKRLSRQISNICGSASSSSVGYIFSNNVFSILCFWACWMSGQVVVPLRPNDCFQNLLKMLEESKAKMIITSKEYRELGQKLAESHELPLLSMDHRFLKNLNQPFNFNREIFMVDNSVFFEGLLQNNFYTNTDAMQVFYGTSRNYEKKWTTYRLSHKHINSQMKELVQIWNMSSNDRILNILPSHEINSYLSTTMFPLVAGSTIQIHDPFDAIKAWGLILGISVPKKLCVNVVIAEPKVYAILIKEYEKIFSKDIRMVEYIREYCSRKIRLMISCNGTLSPETYAKWLEITGHSLFENSSAVMPKMSVEKRPLESFANNQFLTHGNSLIAPNCKVRIMDIKNNILLETLGMPNRNVINSGKTITGYLWISAPDENDFVNTGEIVSYQGGNFKILGRSDRLK